MLPEQFLQRMEEMLGEEYPAFLQSYEGEEYRALRINTLKQSESGESTIETLAPLFCLEQIPWVKEGFYYRQETRPGKHYLHEAGVYYIQEPSAMAPVELLKVRPGERILDLCAAPGGKSTQIAAKLQGKGLLVSNEIHPARAKILSENIERMGVVNACVTNESADRLSEVFPAFFDRILVDAPCSGEGMFRKNEEARVEWSEENVRICVARQAEILDHAATMLRPGGRLVYSTCTFAPQENEGSISSFLERHKDFTLLPIDTMLYYGKEEPMPLPGTLRLYPHKVRGEGHFMAVLEKAGSTAPAYQSKALSGSIKTVNHKDLEECFAFLRDTLAPEYEHKFTDASCRYVSFGENLYLVPEEMPGLTGMRVLRPGLHIGSFKKNRFEPSHALALALSKSQVRRRVDLVREQVGLSGPEAYLKGQTFAYEGQKGWYLICVDGYSLGWGKLAGGIMKNHYPKGLRK